MRRALAALAPLLALCLVALAAVQAAAPAFPTLTGRVVDDAGLLSERDQAELSAALAQFEHQTGDQIVVVTVKSLQELPIEDYGYQLGRHWGIGQKDKDNGALLIVAPNEREVRIEAGYGLEGELTDAQDRTIIETEIVPRFRQGDFAAGIKAGVAAMIETLGGTYNPALPPVQAREREQAPSPWPLIVMLPIIAIFLLNFLSDRRRGSRYRGGYGGPIIIPGGWSNRGSGGGFGGGGFGGGGGGGSGGGFSGGGGSFGGGGATGRW
jgi:uncharacterized protein